MLFIFSTPVLLDICGSFKTVVFLHWCLIRTDKCCSHWFCVNVCASVRLFLSVRLSICPSVCFVGPSVHPSVRPSVVKLNYEIEKHEQNFIFRLDPKLRWLEHRSDLSEERIRRRERPGVKSQLHQELTSLISCRQILIVLLLVSCVRLLEI